MRPIMLIGFFGVMQNIAFISSVMSVIAYNNIPNPLLIGVILSTKRFSRIFFDIPTGIIGDRFGAKSLFMISAISLFISAFCLLHFQKIVFFIALSFIMKGLSDSCASGKIEAQIYNLLSPHNKTYKFGKIISLYYLVMDLVASLTSWLIAHYFANNMDGMLRYMMIMSVACLIIVFFITNTLHTKKVHPSVKTIYDNIISISKNNKELIIIIMLLSIGNTICSVLYTAVNLILSYNKCPAEYIVKIQSMQHLSLSISCIISIFVSDKITAKKTLSVFMIILVIMLIAAIHSSHYYILISMIFYLIFYCTFEVYCEKSIDRISMQQYRITINSIVTALASCYNIISMLIFGLFAKLYNYTISWIMICLFFVCYTLICCIFLLCIKNRKQN